MSSGALFPLPAIARETDERYTPAWIFDGLGVPFDLDVAAPCGGAPNVPAAAHYCAHDDGLNRRWHGLVWCNPPFSNPGPWARRFVAHGSGVFLFPWNSDAGWLYALVREIPALVLLEHMRFDHPEHTGRRVPVACALTALGAGVGPLHELARSRGYVVLRTGKADP